MFVTIAFLIARILQFFRTKGFNEQTDLPKLLNNVKYVTFTQFLTNVFQKECFYRFRIP